MARVKQQERPPEVTMSGVAPASKLKKTSAITLGLSLLAVVWAVVMLTPQGELAYAYVFFFLEFYAGVFSLVLLSATVVGGLLSTDRLILSIKHRVLLQSAHRVGGIGSIIFLVLHIATKISVGKASVLDAFVPFMSPSKALYIGLGTVASYLMFAVLISGLVRHRFIGHAKPWLWRGVHSLSYVSFPIAIMHGLTAGRAAATWVTASYVVCLLLVIGALFLRLTVGNPRSKAGGGTRTATMSGTGTGSFKPITAPIRDGRAATWSQDAPPKAAPAPAFDVLDSDRPAPGIPADPRMAEYAPRARRPMDDEYDDRPFDNGYIDLSDTPARAHVTEQIPVQRERERRQAVQQRAPEYDGYDQYEDEYYQQYARPVSARPEPNLYGRPKADEYPSRRSRLEQYVPDEEGGYEPRRSAELKQIFENNEPMPTSGPPRHRLVEENSDSYVPTSATTPSPKYVGSARPRHVEEAELAPDDTPTLVDMASRRARRSPREMAEPPRYGEPAPALQRYTEPRDISSASGSRRGRRRKPLEESIDERYWVS
jgi:hypothetical protein